MSYFKHTIRKAIFDMCKLCNYRLGYFFVQIEIKDFISMHLSIFYSYPCVFVAAVHTVEYFSKIEKGTGNLFFIDQRSRTISQ